MSKLRRAIVTVFATLLIGGTVAAILSRPAPAPLKSGRFAGNDGPVPVRIAGAVTADVPVYLETVGTARALSTVAVQPQVGGKLMEVAFKEGQTVEKGQVLARIDPATFRAQLEQAQAKKTQDEAQLANAKLDMERYERIPGTIAVKTVDTQRALVAQLTSQVASSKAAVEQAQVQLAFTNVIAPASGRTGIRQVDEGNIVSGSGQTLVTITQVQPIAVQFNLPQQQLAQVNRAMTGGPIVVEAMEADNKTVLDRGRLLVVDNQVDQTTGTVKMKAEFPNATLQQWPGQFVGVRVLIETLGQVVTVPTAAVQRGPAGTFVYVMGEGDKVTSRAVTVPQQDDVRVVLGSGVQAGDRVVTSGFARLKDGVQVTAVTTEQLDAAPVAPKRESPRGEGRKGGEGRKKREQTPQPSATAPDTAVPDVAPAVAPTTPPAAAPSRRAQQAPQASPQ